jgi:hypothetical protein
MPDFDVLLSAQIFVIYSSLLKTIQQKVFLAMCCGIVGIYQSDIGSHFASKVHDNSGISSFDS